MQVRQAEDGRHIAATHHVAIHRAARHLQMHRAALDAVGGRQRFLHAVQQYHVCAALALREAHVGVHSARDHLAQHHGTGARAVVLDAHVRVVARRKQHAHKLLIFVVVVAVVGVVQVVAVIVTRPVVAVVVAVAVAHHVAHDEHVVVQNHIRAVLQLAVRIGRGEGGVESHLAVVRRHPRADVAAHVVTAVHIAEDTAAQRHTARGLHVGHAAAAEHIVADDFRSGLGTHNRAHALRVGQRVVVHGSRH